jgi:hypothetical protein
MQYLDFYFGVVSQHSKVRPCYAAIFRWIILVLDARGKAAAKSRTEYPEAKNVSYGQPSPRDPKILLPTNLQRPCDPGHATIKIISL